MSASPQFDRIIAIGFESREADQVSLREACEAREIKSAHRQAKFAALEQLAREPGPAIFRQLVRTDVFIRDIRSRLNRFARDRLLRRRAAPDPVQQIKQRDHYSDDQYPK